MAQQAQRSSGTYLVRRHSNELGPNQKQLTWLSSRCGGVVRREVDYFASRDEAASTSPFTHKSGTRNLFLRIARRDRRTLPPPLESERHLGYEYAAILPDPSNGDERAEKAW